MSGEIDGVDIVGVWMQHPTARFLAHGMFETLRRWTNLPTPDEDPPIGETIAAMDAGGVGSGWSACGMTRQGRCWATTWSRVSWPRTRTGWPASPR
jgi:hypothetical protein